MLFRLPSSENGIRWSSYEVGHWAGEHFGYEDTWRFRNSRRHTVSSYRFRRTVSYIEIDKTEDALVYRLTFNITETR